MRCFVELPAVELFEFRGKSKHGFSARVCLNERFEICSTMLEAWEEDKFELVSIPLKNVAHAIPKNELEMKELIEDLTLMGSEGLLAKPWNLRNKAVLRDF